MSRLATAPGSAEPKGDAAEGARWFPPACGLGFGRTSWTLSHERRAVMVAGGATLLSEP